MSNSFYKIWIHAIWTTKNREPLIHKSTEVKIHHYIRQQLIESGCPVRIVNGMPDHIHCLFLMNPNKTLSEIIKQVKGSTSHFINQQNIISQKFSWQAGYGAFSVSESGKEKVFEYIKNQKKHHEKRNVQEEVETFVQLYDVPNR